MGNYPINGISSQIIKIGNIYEATIPYNDNSGNKKRPVLVFGWSQMGYQNDKIILVIPITSFSNGGSPTLDDILLNQQYVGMEKISYIRCNRLTNLRPDQIDINKFYGILDNSQMNDILIKVGQLFKMSNDLLSVSAFE